ncbi:hypothetical protein B6U74_05620 [Candidatus Bathyarchaeota archaeon ex4484_205]|nr:MAG: hypothetical protein B6U74_05620 [Candidatus Bathyarchaeota archaeon ex4484_205]RLG69268.1 MAG: hypothetical protein DRN93_00525 [archaeon]
MKRSLWVSGTALFASLTVLLDFMLKFAGLKIPFPLFPVLKFDLDGVPIMMSLYLFGLSSGGIVSFILFTFISLRSGDVFSASMKALAEFSTALGVFLSSKYINFIGKSQYLTVISGSFFRSFIMCITTYITFPLFSGFSPSPEILMFILLFNIIAGTLSSGAGFLLYLAIKKRLHLTRR